ncbi:hypothetical protein Lal_00043716 [Lupinus albus]|nr:hypothetical protein Lal_00043716 [Lupinus albus]
MSKLQPRGDGPFEVLERINNNAYKIDIPSDYGYVSATFNVADLSLFDTGNKDLDSRSNSVQEGGDDSNPPRPINLDDLVGLGGAITRARAKKAQATLGQLVLNIQAAIGPRITWPRPSHAGSEEKLTWPACTKQGPTRRLDSRPGHQGQPSSYSAQNLL